MTKCRKRLKEGAYPRFFSCQIEPPKPVFVICDQPSTTPIKNEASDDPLAVEEQSVMQCDKQSASFRFVECPGSSLDLKLQDVEVKEEVTGDWTEF